MEAPILTQAQRRRFVANGFLVLNDAIPSERLAAARAAVAETVPEDLEDLDELVAGPEDRHYWNDLDDVTPFEPLNHRLREYAASLVGPDRLQPPGEFT